MIKQSIARKLIKNYKVIDSYYRCIEKALCKDRLSIRMLEGNNLFFEERKLRRILNYIDIYKSIFNKNLKILDEFESHIVKEHFIKQKNIVEICMENYIGEVSAYRMIKKFEYYFSIDISKTQRIIKYLLPLCRKKRRKI